MQAYLGAMEEAYRRAASAEGAGQVAALQLFGELAQRIGQAHAGFVAGAGASLAHIIRGGIDFALQVWWITCQCDLVGHVTHFCDANTCDIVSGDPSS